MSASPVNLRIVSIHWGFSLGGIVKYAEVLESVPQYAPISLKSLCIIPERSRYDGDTLGRIDAEVVRVRTPLDPGWIRAAASLCRKCDPHLLLTHGFNGHMVALVLNGISGRRRPTVCSYHGLYHATTPMRVPLAPIYNAFTEHFLRRRACGVVAVAGYCRDYLVRKGVDARKIRVIHNGLPDRVVPKTERERVRNEWGVGPQDVVIGVASRLDPVKGIGYLIDAFATLVGRLHTLRLVIVGTGTLDTALRLRAQRLGIGEYVRFTGFRADIDACMAGFDIFALPSLSEYHSIALLEAMRAGKAIVATDVGGNTESVTDGREALVARSVDAAALAQALRTLATEREFADRLGRAARERFKANWTEEKTVRATAEWLMGFSGTPLGCRRKP